MQRHWFKSTNVRESLAVLRGGKKSRQEHLVSSGIVTNPQKFPEKKFFLPLPHTLRVIDAVGDSGWLKLKLATAMNLGEPGASATGDNGDSTHHQDS
ncbi:hypothetical protein V22_10040 [Calycomorphotria hydatis]|uniref:Uncharacterized protein n=1 Tax=Calycomorphotria hydatis TaxID=2528027 RepID=A0A517T5Y1_9PLAN|nr:hypothetical protein V22_10040 [Calycomorphotria hydatis]